LAKQDLKSYPRRDKSSDSRAFANQNRAQQGSTIRDTLLKKHTNPHAELGFTRRYMPDGITLVQRPAGSRPEHLPLEPDQVDDDNIHSLTLGLNYYIHGDAIKLMADYVHTWSRFREAHPQFGDDNFDEVILRLHLMF